MIHTVAQQPRSTHTNFTTNLAQEYVGFQENKYRNTRTAGEVTRHDTTWWPEDKHRQADKTRETSSNAGCARATKKLSRPALDRCTVDRKKGADTVCRQARSKRLQSRVYWTLSGAVLGVRQEQRQCYLCPWTSTSITRDSTETHNTLQHSSTKGKKQQKTTGS